MTLLLKPGLERLLPQLPTTEPVADDELYMRGPFLALSGIDGGIVELTASGGIELTPAVDGSGGATGMTQDWAPTNPVNHDVIVVNPFTGSGHGPYKLQVQLNENPVTGTYDFGYSDGVFGGSGVGPISYRTRETGWRVGSTTESHEIYDVCQHFPGGASGAVDVADYWPTSRRCGYTYSTFNSNLGTAAAGTIEGKIAVDSLIVDSDFANPDNPSVGEFGTYFSLQPNYADGTMSATFQGKESVLSINCGIDTGAVDPTVTLSSDQLVNLASQAGVTLQYAGGNSTVELAAAGLALSTNADIVVSSSAASSVFRVTATTLEFPTAKDPVAFTNPANTSVSYCSLKLASSTSGDLYFGITSPGFSTGQTYLDGGAGFVQYGGSAQMTFNNVNSVDWVFANGNNQRFRILSTGGFSTPTSTPASATATGVAGTITWDSNYIYVCTATNTWKRVAISTW